MDATVMSSPLTVKPPDNGPTAVALQGGMDTLAERLRYARKVLRKISQEELADMCGWPSHSRITNYEAGSEPDNLDSIERMAAALDVAPGWLAFGEDAGVKLSGEERALLDNFRRADEPRRVAASMLLESAPSSPDPQPTVPGPPARRSAPSPEPIVLRTAITKLTPNNRQT